jgi:hypothetical protein
MDAKRLDVIDSSVKVGSGTQENWQSGYQLRCTEHGDWHPTEGSESKRC